MSDQLLLKKIAEDRDPKAFEALFEKYRTPAFQLARFLTRNYAEAEEVFQESMLGVWRSAERFNDTNAKGWIMRIVTNHALKVIKKRNLRKADAETQDHRIQPEESSTIATRNEMKPIVRTALNNLKERDRNIVTLYYCCGHTQDEIAEILSIPQRTISSHLQKALDHMRAHLAKAGLAGVVLSDAVIEAGIMGGEGPSLQLLEKVANQIASDSKAIKTDANTSASAFRTYGVWMVASLAMVALGATIWLRSTDVPSDRRSKQETVKTSQTLTMPEEISETPNSKPKTFDYTWNFKKGAPDDLKPHFGQWSLTPGNPAMRIGANGVSIVLPVEVTAEPLLLKIRFRTPILVNPQRLAIARAGGFSNISVWSGLGVRWTQYGRIWPERAYQEEPEKGLGYKMNEVRTFYTIVYGRKKLTSETSDFSQPILSECGNPLPKKFKLVLEMTNMFLLEIHLASFDSALLPSVFNKKNWMQTISKLGIKLTTPWQMVPSTLPAITTTDPDLFKFHYKKSVRRK